MVRVWAVLARVAQSRRGSNAGLPSLTRPSLDPLGAAGRPLLPSSLAFFDYLGRFKHRWRDWRAVGLRGVFCEGVKMRRNDSASLGNTQEDVLGVFWCYLKPVRIVEGSGIDANGTGEPLERQIQFGAAGVAEMDIDLFPAAFRNMGVYFRGACGDLEILGIKNRLNQIGSTGCALAEFAVAHGCSDRFGRNFVP